MRTQNEMKEMIIPIMKSKGKVYRKYKKILARKAKKTEQITTHTSDGKETVNQAKIGDYIVKNQTEAKEEYVISPQKFRERYIYIKRSKGGYSEYESTGKVIALEITKRILKKFNFSTTFYFEAPWGTKVVAKENDFLVCPINGDEVYRIGRKEFFETYQPV